MSGDLISRQAVLDGIDTYINKAQSTGTQDDFYSFAELVVKALPSVNPQEPKTDVLDKISKEIKTLSNANPSYWHSGDMVEREEVFEIIDKYKVESEKKE